MSAPTWLSADPHAARVRWRMIVVLCLFGLGMCAVVGRVYHLQVIEQQELLDRQSPVDRSITYTPRRGSVLDRNGVELAVSVKAPSIQARPRLIEDREAAARALAPILSMPYDKVHERLNPKRGFAWLRRQVHPSMAEAVRDLEMRGVEVTEEYKRYYPQQKLAGQIVGFVGIDGNGLEGVESALDRTLAGDATKILAKRDARGKVMLTGETPRFERFEGHSIELTIDEQIQRVAERALAEQVEAYEAKGGYAVAIDVQTGEVLAMANTPSFDPNRFGEFTSSDWRLRSITDTFEPGSVVKPLVLAAAIEEKTVSLTTPFDCEGGRIKIGRYTIRDSHAHDTLSAAEVVQVSSNICAYKIAQTIGRDKLHQYLRDFGFGSRPGLQLRGEQPGLVWPAERWAEVSFANVAFGQGFTATPIQVVNATAAIANGGMLMQPRLVRRVLDVDGHVVSQADPKLVRRVVSPQSASDAARAMALVTRRGGTAPQAAMEDYTVAGKTGTAQKVNPQTRRYDPHMWVASFVGFLPAEKPRIAIGVMVDEPKKSHYGGTVAAPVFKQIAAEAVRVMGIMPLPPQERMSFEDVEPVEAAKPSVAAVAQETPETQDDPQEEVIDLGATRLIDDPRRHITPEGIRMPNMLGLTARQALSQSRKIGGLPALHGWGRVIAQKPEPGALWREDTPIVLELLPSTDRALVAEEPSSGALND